MRPVRVNQQIAQELLLFTSLEAIQSLGVFLNEEFPE
jgi:hypothetical protein